MIRALTGSGLTGFEVWQKVVLTLWCLSCLIWANGSVGKNKGGDTTTRTGTLELRPSCFTFARVKIISSKNVYFDRQGGMRTGRWALACT